MKTISALFMSGMLLLVAGCTTSSKVQQMIDASERNHTEQAESHSASIDVLKRSSMAALETGTANSEVLAKLQSQLEAMITRVKIMQGSTEAAKVMAAANTVKVANLETAVLSNQEGTGITLGKMGAVDVLYEDVMIQHYQMVVESAQAAIAALQADDVANPTEGTVGLAEPIEIVAPDTSVQEEGIPAE